ncbi:hypothetical protein SE17_20420 [Kouleothrix aurantiaca]|uniref:Uncharacterized protein n=1 Tax=Kouleothrix aurantiaca TaxID=186479 RepID=A0A0P9D8A5_9CHLR|nr:hypothetical protein SE17_20420 [Kouleothrix aurantiaca]
MSCQDILQQRGCLLIVPGDARLSCGVDQQFRLARRLTQRAAQHPALLEQPCSSFKIVLVGGEPGCGLYRAVSCGDGGWVGRVFIQGQDLFQPDAPLAGVAAAPPEPPQRLCKPQPKFAAGGA